jgi:LmbE family N-acetylglucosaminyl deacetylase
MQARPEPLEILDEDWDRALAVVAHPDDMEYGAAAAVARWTAQGKTVVYTLITSGEAGIDAMEPERAKPLREAEQCASATIVGVDTVEFLGWADGTLDYGLPLRRDIAAAIRRHRPDIVITGNFRETYGPGALNQADHIAAGRAVLDSPEHAGLGSAAASVSPLRCCHCASTDAVGEHNRTQGTFRSGSEPGHAMGHAVGYEAASTSTTKRSAPDG